MFLWNQLKNIWEEKCKLKPKLSGWMCKFFILFRVRNFNSHEWKIVFHVFVFFFFHVWNAAQKSSAPPPAALWLLLLLGLWKHFEHKSQEHTKELLKLTVTIITINYDVTCNFYSVSHKGKKIKNSQVFTKKMI